MSHDERIVRGVLGVPTSDIPKCLLVVATESFKKGASSRLRKTKTKGRLTTGKYQDTIIGVLDGGVGSPAATMVIEAAAKAKPEALLRADFCGGLLEEQAVGDAFVAESVIVGDGCGSAYFGKGKRIPADDKLTNALLAQSKTQGLPVHSGTIWTTDILLRQTEGLLQEWVEQGAHAVDMETSSILGIAKESGIPAASINCISDLQLHGKPLFGPGGIDPLLIRGIDLVIDVAIHTLVEWQ
jgi:nucleoside phosphorylase